ncbi:MAG: O-antigen ligase family protein [Acidimicrobiales bacterium]
MTALRAAPPQLMGPDLLAESDARPTPRRRPLRPISGVSIVVGLILLSVTGVGAGLLFGLGGALLSADSTMVLAGVVGAAVAVAAASRFWPVLVLMFMFRASLDALKLTNTYFLDAQTAAKAQTEGITNIFEPSTMIGLVFLASAIGWLICQRRAGQLYPVSNPARWFVGLAAAGSLSALGSGAVVTSLGVSLKIWAGALMLVVLEQLYRQNPARVKAILVAGIASLVIPTLISIEQLVGPRQLDAYLTVSRIRGSFVHPNPFATYLVILAVMALALRPHLRRWAQFASMAVFATATVLILFTYARAAWVALIVGILIIGACQDKRLLVAAVGGALAALLLVPSVSARLSDLGETQYVANGSPNSLAWRIGYWQRLLPLASESPVTGIGLDRVMARTPEALMPHNTVVQALVETGIVGLTALVGLVLSSARAVRRAIRETPPGLSRGIAVGAGAAGAGWALQLGSENLLTQAAIFWYLAGSMAFVLVLCAEAQRRRNDDAADPETATEPTSSGMAPQPAPATA